MDGEKIMLGEQQGLPVQNGSRHFIANESEGDIEFLVITQPSATNDREGPGMNNVLKINMSPGWLNFVINISCLFP